MPLGFHKSFRILPGVRLNINKRSMSITSGGKHGHYTVNTRGERTESVNLPGPFSWRRRSRRED
ncbi:DUF4236 domain-containing protein [Actinacidiphila oryziradicis]|jgi:hypothetical protein|uniref:DUF4236 domain-containing protein n=1 Tax=Actinacidiphila oryziradicis TaxID=2571141 RepID=A0A4U0SBG1_9ACTN|nr:DUF4236 domain-containing protein [Actinacidiphila oryziradicis]TKA06700.1 DUF4236 domain-containing protein [Actinacidiphila oryziradicis]